MELYFLRHGVAERRSDWTGDDDLRPLTRDGREAIVRAAAAFVRAGLSVDVIITSPLSRARQTADIVADALGLTDRVVDDPRLAHGFTRKRLTAILTDHADAGRLLLVGHEPDFSATIAELSGGRVVCKKGGLARVDVADRKAIGGELVWLLPPRLTTAL